MLSKIFITSAIMLIIWLFDTGSANIVIMERGKVPIGISHNKEGVSRMESIYQYSEGDENKPRTSRTSEVAMHKAAVKIENFWRNFGKGPTELHTDELQSTFDADINQVSGQSTVVASGPLDETVGSISKSQNEDANSHSHIGEHQTELSEHTSDHSLRFSTRNSSSYGREDKATQTMPNAYSGMYAYMSPYPNMRNPMLPSANIPTTYPYYYDSAHGPTQQTPDQAIRPPFNPYGAFYHPQVPGIPTDYSQDPNGLSHDYGPPMLPYEMHPPYFYPGFNSPPNPLPWQVYPNPSYSNSPDIGPNSANSLPMYPYAAHN